MRNGSHGSCRLRVSHQPPHPNWLTYKFRVPNFSISLRQVLSARPPTVARIEVPSSQSNISLRQAALAHPPTHEKAASPPDGSTFPR